ncbi:MAG: anaerobic sulfatase maturase [Candidatus Brocadiaceae bacterium]|nr:anaerobic sulfatase maturase [Candidatus Brocadiaceae bacterium]
MKKPNLGMLIKPVSADCNMACGYCYYRHVGALYPAAQGHRMAPEVFEAVCEQYLALDPCEVKVGWQGGEPTLMGLDFFRRAVRIQADHARPGDCFGNSLQTNGVVLDDEWCRFLAENRFLVGLSIDGPEDLNAQRRFADGRPGYRTAMGALERLRTHGVEFNVLVVISRANVHAPERVFEFLRAHDLHYSQFIPCTEPAGAPGATSEQSITAAEYAEFMLRIFDAWVANDDSSYYVRRIDNWLHQFFGLPPECCEYRPDCSNLLTIEWNGDVYPCDFFVEPRFRMGNVRTQTLERMLQGRPFRDFVRGAESVPPACTECEWLAVCHAGCYRHRRKLGLSDTDRPYLCEANRRLFAHVFAEFRRLKDGPPGPHLHAFLNRIAQEVAAPPPPRAAATRPPARPHGRAPGRNALCPCGSGLKFKHCCGRARPETAPPGGRCAAPNRR